MHTSRTWFADAPIEGGIHPIGGITNDHPASQDVVAARLFRAGWPTTSSPAWHTRRKGQRVSPDQPAVLRAAERYVAASRRFDSRPTVAAADAVIVARLALQEVFIEAGWVPPRPRQEEMQRDRLLVRQCVGIDDYIGRQSLTRCHDAASFGDSASVR